MAIDRPFHRTIRQLADGSYSSSGNSQYILHPEYAKDPQHYTRAYQLIQNDLLNLFEYVEPCDQNCDTASLKINELLVRSCIEIEANFTAILSENNYRRKGNWSMSHDFWKVEVTHRLSDYRVRFPVWRGEQRIRRPFEEWADIQHMGWNPLNWNQTYNKSKHERYEFFMKATFDVLMDAVSALVVVLSCQFMDEDFSTTSKSRGVGEAYSYDYDPNFTTAIGDYFTIHYPDSWNKDERYGFSWQELRETIDVIDSVDYGNIGFES